MKILLLTGVLVGLYLLRILFRFGSNYMAHKAAWFLVGDLRTKTYDKLQRLHLGFFHDKQTGDLMSRVVNDTRDFELLYVQILPDILTNIVTFVGVVAVLLSINVKLALITAIPLPLILASGFVFAKKVRPYFKISQKKMGELNGPLPDQGEWAFVYYAGRSAGADFASRCCSQTVSMAETASTASGNASGSA